MLEDAACARSTVALKPPDAYMSGGGLAPRPE
jgi:hypothetical protein